LYQKTLAGKPSAEVRRRLEELLEKHSRQWPNTSPERLRAARAVETLEMAVTPEARQVLDTLSKGARGAWLTEDAKAALARRTQAAAR